MFGGSLAPKGQVSLYNQVAGSSSYPTYTYTSLGQAFMNAYFLNNSSYERVLDIVSLGMPTGSSGGSSIRFLTNPVTSTAAAVERMRIQANGALVISTGSSATYDMINQTVGSVSICNAASSALPCISGKTTAANIGLYFVAGTNNTNTAGDMVFNAREYDNTDFATLTSDAFR